MVKKLDAIKFYEIEEPGNTDLNPFADTTAKQYESHFYPENLFVNTIDKRHFTAALILTMYLEALFYF